MPWMKFFVANIVGSVLWVLFWTILAYQFGQHVSLQAKGLHHISVIVAILVPIALVLMFVFGRRALLGRITLNKKEGP